MVFLIALMLLYLCFKVASWSARSRPTKPQIDKQRLRYRQLDEVPKLYNKKLELMKLHVKEGKYQNMGFITKWLLYRGLSDADKREALATNTRPNN